MNDLNLTSAFLSCRAVLPEMLEAGWGRLVLVSSRTAKEGRVGQCAYAVATEGVATLAEVIAERVLRFRGDGQRDCAFGARHAREPPRDAFGGFHPVGVARRSCGDGRVLSFG